MFKRNLRTLIISLGILGVVVALILTSVATNTFAASHNSSGDSNRAAQRGDGDNDGNERVQTINNLKRISLVGSTAAILDPKGQHTVMADANPYKVVIVPDNINMPGLKAGDLLVSNIGGEDKGTTLVSFPKKMGPGHQFNVMESAGLVGPAGIAFNMQSGTIWVACMGANDVQILKPDGNVFSTITSGMFAKPWGITSNNGMANKAIGSTGAFFVSNVADATIDRIDILPQRGQALPQFKVTQIAQLTKNGEKTKSELRWLPKLNVKGKELKDVLLAIDPANNRIAAFPNSSTIAKAANQGVTVFQGKPLNVPGGFAINPINGDLLVVNLADNNMVELNMARGKVVATKQVDNVPVDPTNNNGSALFGVTATKDEQGNLLVYYTDDNTNALHMLSRS